MRFTGAHIGCAGWALRRESAEWFPAAGSHLARYAGRFSAVEINSSFYRPHRPATYARWAASVPDGFRFAVKVPKEITHVRRLVDAEEPLERFLGEATALGPRLGPLLVQLPPSLEFVPAAAASFFAALRRRFAGALVCEPRHPGWFGAEADALLVDLEVARVAADPAPGAVPASVAAAPGGWSGLVYLRLHGSPRIYHSQYSADALDGYARALARHLLRGVPTWCIFDNTAAGAATIDALALQQRLAAALAA